MKNEYDRDLFLRDVQREHEAFRAGVQTGVCICLIGLFAGEIAKVVYLWAAIHGYI